MSTQLTLQETNASGGLLPATFAQVLSRLANVHAATPTPRGVMYGQELRLALGLSPNDPACAAFLLDFAGQGRRVKGAAHGPSAALLTWAFHALARSLRCTLLDANVGREIEASPEARRAAAVAYLTAYEADVLASRTRRADAEDGAAFLAWLAREEHVALTADDAEAVEALGAALPMRDAPALYELLLESDAVEDVFISERELASLLTRFEARTAADG
ncbi:MAG: hypothetical protein KF850_19080 [Labilithrix sp.]|nr:hypothetical protein [Labilithrix sp.]